MFTLKFYKHINDGELVYDVLSCPHYEIQVRSDGSKTVTTYPDTVKEGGVERQIRSENCKFKGDYDVCYVENMHGKTIDTIRPGMHSVNKV